MQSAAIVDGFSRCLGQMVITAHDTVAGNDDFTASSIPFIQDIFILFDFDRDPREWFADRPKAVILKCIDGNDGRMLGHAKPFADDDPTAFKKSSNFGRKRRPPADTEAKR